MEPSSTTEEQAKFRPNNRTEALTICCYCKSAFNLSRKPKLLPCLHSVCQICLPGLAQNNAGPPTFTCPVCDQACRANQIQDSLMLQSLAAANAVSHCTTCTDRNVATSRCVTCDDFMCEKCVEAHRRVKITKDHVIQLHVTPYMMPRKCHRHPNEELMLFCETCERLTCRDCQLSDHRQHVYYYLKDYTEKQKAVLRNVIETNKQHVQTCRATAGAVKQRLDDVVSVEKRLRNELRIAVLKLNRIVTQRAEELLNDLVAVCSAKREMYNQKKMEVERYLALCSQTCYFGEGALDIQDDGAFLKCKSMIQAQQNGMSKLNYDFNILQSGVNIRLQLQVEEIEDKLKRFGNIKVDNLTYKCSPSPKPQQPQASQQQPHLRPPGPSQPQQLQRMQPPGNGPQMQPPGNGPQMQPPGNGPQMQPPGNGPQMRPPGNMPNNPRMVGQQMNPMFRMPQNQGPGGRPNFPPALQANNGPPGQTLRHVSSGPPPLRLAPNVARSLQQQQQQQFQQQRQQAPPPYTQVAFSTGSNRPTFMYPVQQGNISSTSVLANTLLRPVPMQPQIPGSAAANPGMAYVMTSSGMMRTPMAMAQLQQRPRSQSPQRQLSPAHRHSPATAAPPIGVEVSRPMAVQSSSSSSISQISPTPIQPHPLDPLTLANDRVSPSAPVTSNARFMSILESPVHSPVVAGSSADAKSNTAGPAGFSNATSPAQRSNETTDGFEGLDFLNSSDFLTLSEVERVIPLRSSTESSTSLSNASNNSTPTTSTCSMANVGGNPTSSDADAIPAELFLMNQGPASVQPAPTPRSSREKSIAYPEEEPEPDQERDKDSNEATPRRQSDEEPPSDSQDSIKTECRSADQSDFHDVITLDSPTHSGEDKPTTASLGGGDSRAPRLILRLPRRKVLDSHTPTSSITDGSHNRFSVAENLASQKSVSENDDYCSVCHNGGDLLCCDLCPRTFHKECHVPPLGEIPEGDWFCPFCTAVPTTSAAIEGCRLGPRLHKLCELVLLQCLCHEYSAPFQRPVDEERDGAPGYFQIVKQPMDLGSIKQKLVDNGYWSVHDFIRDMNQVFINCALYNDEDCEMRDVGRAISYSYRDAVKKKLREWLPYVKLEPTKDERDLAKDNRETQSDSEESRITRPPNLDATTEPQPRPQSADVPPCETAPAPQEGTATPLNSAENCDFPPPESSPSRALALGKRVRSLSSIIDDMKRRRLEEANSTADRIEEQNGV